MAIIVCIILVVMVGLLVLLPTEWVPFFRFSVAMPLRFIGFCLGYVAQVFLAWAHKLDPWGPE